jgi:hypothetical protein
VDCVADVSVMDRLEIWRLTPSAQPDAGTDETWL